MLKKFFRLFLTLVVIEVVYIFLANYYVKEKADISISISNADPSDERPVYIHAQEPYYQKNIFGKYKLSDETGGKYWTFDRTVDPNIPDGAYHYILTYHISDEKPKEVHILYESYDSGSDSRTILYME